MIPKGSSKSTLKEFKDLSKILLYSNNKLIYFNMEGEFELKMSFETGYGMIWDFLGENYLLRGFGDIYVMDINSIKEINETFEKYIKISLFLSRYSFISLSLLQEK